MEIQIKILQFLQEMRNDYFTAFFTAITMMAEELYLTLFIAVFYWCLDKKKAMRLGFFVLFNSIANSVIKSIVQMPRPFTQGIVTGLRTQTATGYSFPSGHTEAATSFWMGSMLVFKTKASVIIGSCVILLTAFSRMYLGVHWPMDVLGGILFGLIFTYFANEMMDEEGKVTAPFVMISSLGLLLILIFPVNASLYKAIAGMWGLCLGAYLEQKYVHFDEKTSRSKQVIKIIVGMIGLVLIRSITKISFIPDGKAIMIIQSMFYTLWITLGAPWCFTKLVRK